MLKHKKNDETDEEFQERLKIENALTDRIYYGNYEPERVDIAGDPYKGYYIKYATYEIDEKQKVK